MRELVVDVGNTRTKVGLFSKDDFEVIKVSDFSAESLKRILNKYEVESAILSSTRHLSSEVQAIFMRNDNFFILDHQLLFPFQINYETPETLGRDRIAGVAYAWHRFPYSNSLIVDAGSCITYDLIDTDGQYNGGIISPGIHMRLKAMHHFTEKLPESVPQRKYLPLGRNTTEALQAGAEMGALREFQGFVQYYKRRFKNLNILLTGGDSPFFVNYSKTKIFAVPDLVLHGLHQILRYNAQTIK